MYAVINNVMGTIGSNGVVYECEGHEARLSDCMISPTSPETSGTIGSNGVFYECEDNETRLSDCMISSTSPETSCHYALVNCFPKTQVFVAQTSHDPKYGYYLTVQEGDGHIQVCLQTNRVVTEPLHVHVETTHTDTTGNISHMPAIGKQVYTHVLIFHICIITIYKYIHLCIG